MYLQLFAHNILVRGKDKGCIYDLHNNDVTLIPNVFCDIVEDCVEHSIEEVQKQYAPEDPEVFDQYVQFIVNKNLGFTTEDPHLFPPLNTHWTPPHHIQNCVIEYNEQSPFSLSEIILKMDELLCRQMELRISIGAQPIEDLTKELLLLNGKAFRNVTLFLDFNESMTAEKVVELYNQIPKLGYVFIYGSPTTTEVEENKGKILFTTRKMADFPFIDNAEFKNKYIVNITYFMEALKYNPFYNKKMAIDAMGNIKNDLMLDQSFGNIKDGNLNEIIESDSFQELWHAAPDKIVEVKDSALRYCQHLPYALRKNEEGEFEIV